jgi:hypothetical protein
MILSSVVETFPSSSSSSSCTHRHNAVSIVAISSPANKTFAPCDEGKLGIDVDRHLRRQLSRGIDVLSQEGECEIATTALFLSFFSGDDSSRQSER